MNEAFAAEAKRRAPLVFRARTAALAVVAVLVTYLAGFPSSIYFLALIAGFILIGGLQFLMFRRGVAPYAPYLFVALDMMLLVFTLLYPNPFAPDGTAPQMMLRNGSFIYLMLILAVVAISLSPRLILWTGAVGAAAWAVGIWLVARLPDSITDAKADPARAFLPTFVDLGVQIQSVIVFMIVAVVLAISAFASRRLLRREVYQARLTANLSRYLPEERVAALAARDEPFGGDREGEAAVLFADIVGFSAYAEAAGPLTAMTALRETHALIADAVFAHHGAIDKFIGDGAMATFGAAGARPGDGAHAFNAVQDILSRMKALNQSRRARGDVPLRLSIGLHYGKVLTGDVGSERRMEFAVIGDVVNVAARLEAMTRQLGVAAVISDAAYQAAERPEALRPLGPQPIRGRGASVDIWVMDVLPEAGGPGSA